MVNGKKRGFSLYDIEDYLREAGAERVNEKALISFEKELEETVEEIVNEASVYANHAGRKRIIKYSDIELLSEQKPKRVLLIENLHKKVKHRRALMLNKQMREF
ncbi:MAG: histone-like protein [Candidatus Micrarchaeia archaeon]